MFFKYLLHQRERIVNKCKLIRVSYVMSLIQEETELEFPWMNLHHRVLEADGHRINQGQVGLSY